MNKNKTLLVLAVIAVIFVGFVILLFKSRGNRIEDKLDNSSYGNFKQILGDEALAQKMREREISIDNEKRDVAGVQRGVMMAEAVYTHTAILSDVSGGKGAGIAKAGYADKTYNLSVSFANLVEPENGDFYEGWLVRREPFNLLSTGKAQKLGGVYSNLYKSENNLLDYEFYVLTIERNDGDSAPGVHILEGELIRN